MVSDVAGTVAALSYALAFASMSRPRLGSFGLVRRGFGPAVAWLTVATLAAALMIVADPGA